MKTIAIMQPTFIPWIGYFSLIDQVDEFIFLDNVQFDKRSWQQRNQIKTQTGPQWLTIPVVSKGKSNQIIKDVLIKSENKNTIFHKISTTIKYNYHKTDYFEKYFNSFSEILIESDLNLSTLNQTIIKWLCDCFCINTRFLQASKLDVSGNRADLLVSICNSRNASHYISTPGSKNYLSHSNSFQDAKIFLSYQNYNHPTYNQTYGDFIPYMSAIDLLFNEGPKSLSTIKQGLD